jgi:thioredoxin-like negative regulator of GroEL
MTAKGQDDFSFSSAPEGKEEKEEKKQDFEFSFDSIPVLGQKEAGKAPSIADLRTTNEAKSRKQKKEDKPQKDNGKTEEVKVDAAQNEAKTQEGDIFGQDEWSISLPYLQEKRKGRIRRIIIIASASLFIIVIIAVVLIISRKQQKDNSAGERADKTGTGGTEKSEKEKERERQSERERKKFEDTISRITGLIEEKNYAEAKPLIADLLKQKPECSALYSLSGKIAFEQNQHEVAFDNYMKAIASGSPSPDPYLQASELCLLSGKSTEAEGFIEKALVKFPQNQALFQGAIKFFLKVGKPEKAANMLDKIDLAAMSKEEINGFAQNLSDAHLPKESTRMYLYVGKKFLDPDFFEKAIALESNPNEKVDITNEAINLFDKDATRKNRLLVSLVSQLFKMGNKKAAEEELKKVEIIFLKSNEILVFAQKTLELGKEDFIKETFENIANMHSANYPLLKKLQNMLKKNNKYELMADIFSDLWKKNEQNAELEYLYARAFAPLATSITHYKEVIKKQSSFFDAHFELGECLIAHRRYKEADAVFVECLKLNPSDLPSQENLFLSRFYQNKSEDIIINYEKALQEARKKEAERAEILIKYAQMLENPLLADKYLNILNREKATCYDYWKVRNDFIYWREPEKNFSGKYPAQARELYLLYMLGKGKIKDVMLLPTPPEQFPEFWKVFLAWKYEIDGWKESVMLFNKKHNDDFGIKLIMSVMLGDISPEEARQQIFWIPYDLEPLFYLTIAEQYRKNRNMTNAGVCYTKAAGDGLTIYKKAIQYFEKN